MFRILPLVPVLVFSAAAGDATSRLKVRVDPRIELMTVTQMLADYGWTRLITNEDTPYRRDVVAWFTPFRDHGAVRRFTELSKEGYVFDEPAKTMVCLSSPPELKLEGDPEECGGRAPGAARLSAWIDDLRDFWRVSNFDAFFRAHAGFYGMAEEQTRRKITRDYAADLEAYHGIRQASYSIVPAPLLSGNFGVRRRRPDGAYDIYGVLGSSRSVDGVPQFGGVEELRRLVWHEFGHSFSNPEVDALRSAVEKSAKLLDPIAAPMKAAAYPGWHAVVYEHVDRAIEVRLAYRELGEEAGERALTYQKAHGFAYVETLSDRLREYEGNRDRYPTFRDFAPRLMAALDELAARDLPLSFFDMPPTIGAGLARPPVYVVPTAEADADAQRKIVAYVTLVRDRLAKNAEILTDEQALARDLSGFAVLAFGTVTGNRWLARHRDSIPALPALAKFAGSGPIRLVAAMPDAQGKVFGVAFAATETAAVPGVGSLSYPATAYVIGRNTDELASGFYSRRDGKWTVR